MSEADSCLFTACTDMIFYSIVEPHNADHVMKQFGWRQILPPPLHPIPWRDEKSSNVTIDYRVKLQQQVQAWENRVSSVIDGEYDNLVGRHSNEYFAWYHRIIRLRVERPPHGMRDAQYEHAVQQMDIFLKHIVATVDSVDEKYDSWFLYKIMQTIQHQCVKLSAACSARFENFNLEECINSGSYENFSKENQEEGMGQVPPAVHTPQPSPFANPSHAPHPPPFVTPSTRP
ncbi:hypothetical protein MRB53_020685 [Persea americana]|uniref:Uncharacterized protein n=1 Tax=Persea americana TaxID=3435 RepID=A0ACC2L1Y3_PERAE|nr:hypothetical protein MRB53_020685 [Persea americana]